MSEEDLRIQQIKMKIKGLTFEQARDISNLCSEYYMEGLEQSRFDKRMLEIQVSSREEVANKYKEVIEKANNELITLIQIIMKQPSKDVEEDNYLLSRLESISNILVGGKNE